MSGVAFKASSTDTNPVGTAVTLLRIPTPSGVVDGDFLLAHIAIAGGAGTSVSIPFGWTQVRRHDISTSVGLLVAYRFASGDTAGGSSWSFGASGTHAGVVSAYSGVDSFNVVDADDVNLQASTSTPSTPPLVTTVQNSTLAVCLAIGAGNVTVSPPTGYQSRAIKSQTNDTIYLATSFIGTGIAGSSTSSAPGGGPCISHAIVLRPAIGQTSVAQVDSALKALFPPGDDDLYDWNNSSDPSELWKMFQATAGFFKAYTYDYVDLLRQEVNPLTVVAKLPEWEGALGITQASASAANKWIATRQAAVLSKLRESGATTLAAVGAVLEPLLGYTGANAGTLQVLETNRAALTAAHTYSNNTGAVIGGFSSVSQSVTVLDDGAVSAAGVQIAVTITTTNPEQLSFTLTGPTGTNGQASVTWPAGSLPVGSVTSTTFYLYEHATSAGKSIFANGISQSWNFQIFANSAGCTLVSWALFVEGGGRDANGYDGLGAAAFRWEAYADPAKVVNPDYFGAANALTRIQPGYSLGELVQNASAVPGSSLIPPFLPRST